jgi:hypothetical protein
MKDKDCILKIFKYITSVYPLSLEYLMDKVEVIFDTNTIIFKKENTIDFLCIYKNDQELEYELNKVYKMKPNRYTKMIYNREMDIIGCILLESDYKYDKMDKETRDIINNIIMICIKIRNLTDTKFLIIHNLCYSLSIFVEKVTKIINEMSLNDKNNKKNLEMVNVYLTDIMNIIYDSIDYIEISQDKIILDNNIIEIEDFIKQTLLMTTSTIGKIEFSKTLPRYKGIGLD